MASRNRIGEGPVRSIIKGHADKEGCPYCHRPPSAIAKFTLGYNKGNALRIFVVERHISSYVYPACTMETAYCPARLKPQRKSSQLRIGYACAEPEH